VYVLSARLSLELSECKAVPTLWGDSWVNSVVQGSPEALGPKWLTGNRRRPSGFAWCGDDTLFGGRGDPLPWWRSSLVESASHDSNKNKIITCQIKTKGPTPQGSCHSSLALKNHVRASSRVCQNLLGKSYVLPTSKKLCKVKKKFISNSLA
jgi:hypothetical protein